MRQTLHLLIVGNDGCVALAAWHGVRWMLPILDIAERVRAAPAMHEWLVAHGIIGEVAGQWLGRMQPTEEAIDWILLVRAWSTESTASPAGLQWTPLRTLRASAPLVDYQRWAVSIISPDGGAPVARGPFGDLRWLDEVRAWIGFVLGRADRHVEIVPHRVSAYDLVLECHTARGRWFLKGLSKERAVEMTVTERMQRLMPDAFAHTVGHTTRADGSVWWLMDECPGVPLANGLTVASSMRVVSAYADVQRRLLASDVEQCRLPAVDLEQLATWATTMLDETPVSDAQRSVATIREACQLIETSNVPHSWIAADLDPSNVLVRAGEVRFIDLDDALWGAAPLAVSTFARRIRRLSSGCAAHVRDAYQAAWAPRLDIDDRWPAFDLVSRVLEWYLGWQRIVLKADRHEIHDVAYPARRMLAAKLVKACGESAAAAASAQEGWSRR